MTAMEGYKGRKAPNVSSYLANLNALPSAHDVASQQQQQQQQQQEDFSFDDELAQFTNAEFLDQDVGDYLEQQPMSEYGPALEEKARRDNSVANNEIGGRGMDFITGVLHRPYRPSTISPKTPSSLNRKFSRFPNNNDSSLTRTHQATSHSQA